MTSILILFAGLSSLIYFARLLTNKILICKKVIAPISTFKYKKINIPMAIVMAVLIVTIAVFGVLTTTSSQTIEEYNVTKTFSDSVYMDKFIKLIETQKEGYDTLTVESEEEIKITTLDEDDKIVRVFTLTMQEYNSIRKEFSEHRIVKYIDANWQAGEVKIIYTTVNNHYIYEMVFDYAWVALFVVIAGYAIARKMLELKYPAKGYAK